MTEEIDSILDSIKQTCGVASDYTPFDIDIIMHINSVLADLTQLGVGPVGGFAISDNTAVWEDFLGPNTLFYNNVKSYVSLRVKFLFDGPESRYVIANIAAQIKEWEWRISVQRETTAWVDPQPPVISQFWKEPCE